MVVDNNEHHPALLGRFVMVAPSVNVQNYILTKRSGLLSDLVEDGGHVVEVLLAVLVCRWELGGHHELGDGQTLDEQ